MASEAMTWPGPKVTILSGDPLLRESVYPIRGYSYWVKIDPKTKGQNPTQVPKVMARAS
jgi:hypothetical protein